MDSSVPRKVAQLAQAFAVHAEANAEETAEIVGQVGGRVYSITPLRMPRLRGGKALADKSIPGWKIENSRTLHGTKIQY